MLTASVLEPEAVIVCGVKVAVLDGGIPLTSNVTVPVNPAPGVTVTV